MAVKDNVRQRRQDKIKKLMEHEKNQPSAHESQVLFPASPMMDEQIYAPTPHPYDTRLEDPEFVWKQQHASRWQYPDSPYLPGIKSRTYLPSRNFIRIKLLISVVLFGLIWGMFHLQQPWALKGQQYTVLALTQDLEFYKIAQWYEKKFDGAPSFIPTFHFIQEIKDKVNKKASLYAPAHGVVIQPFSKTKQGILLETQADAPVSAFDAGRVIFAGQTSTTGMTVIIQHAGSRQSFYGWLENVKVEKNDWVKGGQQIATVMKQSDDPKGKLYYAIKQNNQYINPTDVISID